MNDLNIFSKASTTDYDLISKQFKDGKISRTDNVIDVLEIGDKFYAVCETDYKSPYANGEYSVWVFDNERNIKRTYYDMPKDAVLDFLNDKQAIAIQKGDTEVERDV